MEIASLVIFLVAVVAILIIMPIIIRRPNQALQTIHTHDPEQGEALHSARRHGSSAYILGKVPSIVYTQKENITTTVVDLKTGSTKIDAQTVTCPVCEEDFAEGQVIRRLPCHHIYHKGCFDRWIRHSKVTCPLWQVSRNKTKTKLTNCSRINLQKYFAEQDERELNSRDLINDTTLTHSISADEEIASPLQTRFRRLSHSIDVHLVENAEAEEPNATQRIHAYFSEYGRSAQMTSGRRIRRLAGMILPHWRSGTNDMPATVNPRESPEPRSTSPGNQNLIIESPPAAHLSGDHRVVL
jgi:hypothetical protein